MGAEIISILNMAITFAGSNYAKKILNKTSGFFSGKRSGKNKCAVIVVQCLPVACKHNNSGSSGNIIICTIINRITVYRFANAKMIVILEKYTLLSLTCLGAFCNIHLLQCQNCVLPERYISQWAYCLKRKYIACCRG